MSFVSTAIHIFFHSLFDPDDIERERGVILQEIRTVQDTPDEYVHDLFYRDLWGNSPLGSPISGTFETVGRFTRGDIVNYFQQHYLGARVILAVAVFCWVTWSICPRPMLI